MQFIFLRYHTDDMVLYESDDLEYVSDDDLGQELDLEVYGIKVTPQPSIPGENTPYAGKVHAEHDM